MLEPQKTATAKLRAKKIKEKDESTEKKSTETWGRAIFHWNEIPGGTWSARPNLKKEVFTDGETYERPLALFQLLNDNCKVVVRKEKQSFKEDQPGEFVKTKSYKPRLYFEILERFEKEV